MKRIFFIVIILISKLLFSQSGSYIDSIKSGIDYCNIEFSTDTLSLNKTKKFKFIVKNSSNKNVKIAKNFDGFLYVQAVNIEKFNTNTNKFEMHNLGFANPDCFSCKSEYEVLKPNQKKSYLIPLDSITQFKDFKKDTQYKFLLYFELYTLTQNKCNQGLYISDEIIYYN